MQRSNSSASLKLLDPDLTDEDVFNPPAWLPGRFLQFTDISLDDEQSARSTSCALDRVVPDHEDTSEDFVSFRNEDTLPTSFVVEMMMHSLGSTTTATTTTNTTNTTYSSSSSTPTSAYPTNRLHRPEASHRVTFMTSALCLRSKVAMVVTSCMTVALTALTLLTFALS
ncbi:uncharacterized protein LOC143300450 [Babylonia areolata]|uniref:uncharacterized protein LOC143300450 n=1 Tax=Babylonia areolata TaxID=304850 RepID=UPI003FD0814A